MHWKEAALVLVLAVALLALVTAVGQAQMISSTANTDNQALAGVSKALREATLDNKHKMTLRQEMKGSVGRSFWSDCFKRGLLEPFHAGRLASQGPAGDIRAETSDVQEAGLTQGQCSYTSPKGGELLVTMELKGNNRAVLFCFDSRNWYNYPRKGVLVAWSTGEVEYLAPTAANEKYGITEEEWKEPATKILGVKKPFHRTWQEAECAAFKNAEMPEQDDIDYSAVYRKKGRVVTFKLNAESGGRVENVVFRCTVKDLTETEATVLREVLDEDGKPKGKNSTQEEVVDITDKTCAKPPRGKRVKDSATEIEAAGRKWKVEKWAGKFGGNEESELWMSTEIPGLIVRASTPSMGMTIVLHEFKDPEEEK